MKGDHDLYYYFPDPGLVTFANAERQKVYLRQLNHVLDSLIYRASSVHSDALPVHPQKWRNLLGLTYKRDTSSTSNPGFKEAEDLLGSCMRAQGVAVNLMSPPLPDDVPFDRRRGQELVWHLSELNFRAELLALDGRQTHAPPSGDDEDIATVTANFRMAREQAVLKVFPEQSVTFADATVANTGLSSHDWKTRATRLQALRDVMQKWDAPLPVNCLGCLAGTECDEVGYRIERMLAAHYAQTFYDSFGRAAVLPRGL